MLKLMPQEYLKSGCILNLPLDTPVLKVSVGGDTNKTYVQEHLKNLGCRTSSKEN